MATYKEIFEIEKQREDAAQWNIIHLFKDGNSYKAYEWSAWLAREYATTEEWRKQVGVKQLSPVHKEVRQTTGSIIFVGFPMTSIDKFIPKNMQVSFTPVDDNRIDIAIELPAEQMGEMKYDQLLERVQDWKKQFPMRKANGDKDGAGGSAGKAGGDAADDLLSLLTGQPVRPMRMSDILAQIVALPLDDITPNDALKVLRILKRQCSALF